MDSWDEQTPSPALKFEDSPAESFLSAPEDMYPSLFDSSPGTATMNPHDIMTPRSFSEDKASDDSALAGLSDDLPPASDDGSPSGDKKQTKKRKSWGQVLPEPKTNLPPRKRAKTEDEKEQRRVERVLRNRRAAQSSRERKRLEVEALETRNKELESMVLHLVEELNKARRDTGVVSRTSASLDALRPSPVTLSPELFSSQDGHSALDQTSSALDLLMSAQSNNTVNPASLSPELSPVPDAKSSQEQAALAPSSAAAAAVATTPDESASPDLTQHPAEMLCEVDLQCQLAEVSPRPVPWLPAAAAPWPHLLALQQLHLLVASTSAILSVCQRPLTQIAMSLRAGFSLPPTPLILNTIIWLVTMSRRDLDPLVPTTSAPRPPAFPSRTCHPPTSTSSTSTSSSTTRSCPSSITTSTKPSTPSTHTPPSTSRQQPPSTLRLRSLRKILTCSPTLARPLMDATMAVLRLVSSEEVPRRHGVDSGCENLAMAGASGTRSPGGAADEVTRKWWAEQSAMPSPEVLLTLLWALRVEEKRASNGQTHQGQSDRASCRATLKRHQPPLERESSCSQSDVVVGGVIAKRRRFA